MNLLTIPMTQTSRKGAVWNKSITIPISTLTTNDAYIIPCLPDFNIGFRWTGAALNPVIQFTFDSLENIQADTAVWSTWNKTDAINKAITAMIFTNTSTTVPASVFVTIRGVLNV